MPIGPWEIVLLVLIIVLVFGARRLPEIGRGLGKGMREFKDSLTGKDDEKRGAEPTELTAAAVEEDEEPVAAASGDGRERDTASSSSS